MKRFKDILLVCDEGSAYEHALERVAWLADTNGARVTLVDVIDHDAGELSKLIARVPGFGAKDVEEDIRAARLARLQDMSKPLVARGVDMVCEVLEGPSFIRIIQHVLRHGHDLVIKGAQRSPGQPFFRGPDMHLMRKCPCPVWVLNSAAGPQSRRILAAVNPDSESEDRAALSRTIMQLSTSLARQDNARLDVMKVWQLDEENILRHGLAKVPPDDIDRLVAHVSRTSEADFDGLLGEFNAFDDLIRALHIKGIAEDVISEHVEAEGIDTVVMGSVGRTGVAGLFIGNTAETILNRVTCSVLTVKPEGFVSPVSLDDAMTQGEN